MKKPKISRAKAVVHDEDLDLLRALGDAIRGHRITAGISRHAMADRLIIGEQTLIRIEQGDPSTSMGYYLAACRLLGISLLEPAQLLRLTQGIDHTRRRASAVSRHDRRFG